LSLGAGQNLITLLTLREALFSNALTTKLVKVRIQPCSTFT
jgi:hypothetical protein